MLSFAVFFSLFGLGFSSAEKGTGIVLPGSGEDLSVDPGRYASNLELMRKVNVDRSNIKSIIRALSRPGKYHISANSTVYYSAGQASVAAEAYVADGMSRSIVYGDGGAPRKNCIIAGDSVFLWEAGSSDYYVGSKGAFSEDDYIYIPTYEKILDMNDEDIISADYSLYNELYCLLVVTSDIIGGYRSQYYISAENGLLIGAQRFDGDALVYSMSCAVLDFPEGLADIFTLPDGRSLLENGGAR